MLLAIFPNLKNGVLEIKDEEDENGNKLNALITTDWRSVAPGVRQPHVPNLVGFGCDPISKETTRIIR
jgi:hypothetical protein